MEIYIAKSGKETGPFTKEQIAPMLDSGMLTLTDSVWHKELTQWIPVHQFLNVRPPIPVAPSISVSNATNAHTVTPVIRSGDPAPFGRRVLAHLIDTVICIVASFVIYGLLLVLVAASGLMGTSSTIGTWLEISLMLMAMVLPTWLYHAWWESSKNQATPGKMALDLVVTDMQGQRLKFEQASKRSMGKLVSEVFWGIIFLTCLLNKNRQCLHDVLSGCIVRVK